MNLESRGAGMNEPRLRAKSSEALTGKSGIIARVTAV
jgi:hypothetical protein